MEFKYNFALKITILPIEGHIKTIQIRRQKGRDGSR